ncbi:MAG TPA: DNA-directed RNA polymerase [Nanoarchaeota archaeon]|nr:DNA-directed RNA polymerase [Nanoarchaeota archaeon]
MYWLVTLEKEVRVSPEKLEKDIEEAVSESISETFEGLIDPKIGVFLAVDEILEIGEGKVYPEDPGVHFPCKFRVLAWKPVEKEVVEGEVVDVTEFGIFIRIGAIDGFVHISQIMDDYVSYDEKNSMLVGRNSKKTIKEGDKVRARVISISFKKESKIALTMRQPWLGALQWIERERKKNE